jgi:integrase/recombinase XerD
MSSTTSLQGALDDYLALRRALGFKLHSAGRLLNQFVAYLEEQGTDVVTTDNALSWATLPVDASPAWISVRLRAVRGFAGYLHSTGPAHQVPPAGLVYSGSDRATPYLYSGAEIAALMQAAAGLRPQLRAATYRTFIGLMSCTGLRPGEAIALDDTDLDHDDAVLQVHNSKFGKSRLVPLHPSALRALDDYRALRDELQPGRASPALLVSTRGTRLWHSNVLLTFARLADQAGLAARSGSCRPRLHDFRHSWAVSTLLDGYARDADISAAQAGRLKSYLS